MQTRSLTYTEVFPIKPDALFALLITPTQICRWWSARTAIVIPQDGGLWAAVWGEDLNEPDYQSAADITRFDPPHCLRLGNYRYYAKDGPLPFEADFSVTFDVMPSSDAAQLTVTQAGFPASADANSEADAYYLACEQGWRDTFAGIKRLAESMS